MRDKFTSRLLTDPKIYLILSVIILLILFRITLPYLGLYYLNQQINKDRNYHGHISNLDISFWHRSITLKEITISINNAPSKIPLFTATSIELFLQLTPLLSGKKVMDIKITHPVFNYLIDVSLPQSGESRKSLTIRKFEINNGEINIINFHDAPHFKIAIKHVHIELHKTKDSPVYLVDSKGQVMNSGNFYIRGKLNPFSKEPNFYIESALKGLAIPEFNSILKHYTDITARDGTFNLFVKFSAKNGKLSGYAKPFLKNLSIIEKKDDNIVKKIYKKAVKVSAKILQNSQQKTNATKINISGNINDPNIDMLSVVLYLLQHAFIQALVPSLDNQFSDQDIVYNQSNTAHAPHYQAEFKN